LKRCWSVDLARTYALARKSEEAVKWLRITVKEGFPLLSPFCPWLIPRIREDPVFMQFMTEMKTRWQDYQRQFA
jgi:hypothetical protein